MKGRLAILAPLKQWGGIEGKLVTLCREFAERGIETELVRPRGGEIPYPDRLPATVRTLDLQTSSKRDGVPAFIRYLRQRRPDAVLTAKDHAAQVAVLARLLSRSRVPVFIKVTNTLSDVARRPIKRAMIRRLYPRANAIIANSRSGAEDLVKHFAVPRERVRIIHNPTVTPDFEERASRPVGHPWLSDDATPVILGVGRLTPQKDFATLIEAFARVRQRQSARLIVLGEGPERGTLTERVRHLGVHPDVDLVGSVEDALPWIRRANLLALSSRYEGLANVLIEALALGTPAVATDCGGVREILDDGRLGPIVPPGAPNDLADAIEQALANPLPSSQLIAGTRRFESKRIADEYLTLFGEYTTWGTSSAG